MDRFRSFLNIERGEEAPTLLLFFYLTLALTSYIIAKAVRDSLFLVKFSAMTLPYVYVGVAVLVGFVVSIYVRVSSYVSQATLISGTLTLFIGNVLLLWWAIRLQWPPIAAVLYVWASIFGIIVTTQVWTVANSVLDLRQAKRLFPLISSGGILGSAAGGLIAAKMVKFLGTDDLLLVIIPLLTLSVAIVQVLTRRYGHFARQEKVGAGPVKSQRGVRTVFGAILSSHYLKLIVALLALSAIVTLIVDFQFKVVVQQSFHSKNQFTSFFGSFYAYLSLFAFLLQILAGSRIVEKFGVRVTLLVLPVALFCGTTVLLAYPFRLWAGSLLKGSDHTLRYSIDKSTIELLYLPVPQSLKAEAKAVMDIVLQRLADGVGGVLLLVITSLLGLGFAGVGLFNLALLSVWVWVALETRKEYVATLRANLSERPALPKSTLRMVFGDRGSVATLQSMLNSRDEEVVLYAIDLAVALNRKDWIPSHLTAHSSSKVRLKAMEVLPMTEAEILERVRSENNSAVRASAIVRACNVVQPGQLEAALYRYLDSPELKVRLSALVCLARQLDGGEPERLKEYLASITAGLDEKSEEWKDVAEAMGEIRHPAAVDLHLRLLRHPSAAVKKQAILSAGRAGHRELVPFLVPVLADREYGGEARQALREYGPRILGTLADILKDPLENIEIRRNIPLVLAYIPYQTTVDLLLDSLFDYDGLLRYRATRALGKLRVIDPDLHFDLEKVSMRVREECEKTIWYQQALTCLYLQGDSPDLLAQLLKDKIYNGKERVFRLLALMLPPTAACASFLALAEDDRLKKASVAEYLDNVLPGKLRQHVLPLVEPKPGLFKAKRDIRKILEAFLKSPDEILRDCTADAISKKRWPEISSSAPAGRRLKEGFSYG